MESLQAFKLIVLIVYKSDEETIVKSFMAKLPLNGFIF